MSQVLLLQGNALHIPLQDRSCHVCVTSPPYLGLRDYGTATWQGGDAACDHRKNLVPFSPEALAKSTIGAHANTNHASEGYKSHCGHCGATRVDQQLGLEATLDAYVDTMVQAFREVKRVLRDDGLLFLNLGDSYRDKQLLGMPWRVAFALQDDGWILRSDIIWEKPSCLPESVQDRCTRSHEYVFMFAKQARYFYDNEAVKERVGELTRRNAEFRVVSVYKDHIADGISNHAQHPEGISHPGPSEYTGRNARTVWRITSEGTSFAHFATFPTALVRKCLLAGAPTQVCAACGAPWRREVEAGPVAEGYTPGYSPAFQVRRFASATKGFTRQYTTLGFSPTCACSAGVSPATVFDPFVGSGTVPLVARELGHTGIGCDLSYAYLHDIARARLGLADLARWEGQAKPLPPVDTSDLPLFQGAAPHGHDSSD